MGAHLAARSHAARSARLRLLPWSCRRFHAGLRAHRRLPARTLRRDPQQFRRHRYAHRATLVADPRQPQTFDPDQPWPDVSPEWLEHFRRNRLGYTITHAFVDDARALGSYFGFHRLPQPAGEYEVELLLQLVPVLHEAFLRVVADYERSPDKDIPLTLNGTPLSIRESEIARLVGHGKSNGEIATLLRLSENTIKHHVSNILDKTGCASRAGIVAAVQQQLGPRHGTRVL